MPLLRSLAITLAISVLAGCSYFQFPGVHKVEIQQGNIITQDMIDQLQPGMTRSQVRYIMGTPLIADTFNQDRWDYFYSVKKSGEREKREQVTLIFQGDNLVGIQGDFSPSGAAKVDDAGS